MQQPIANIFIMLLMAEAFLLMALGYMVFEVKERLKRGNVEEAEVKEDDALSVKLSQDEVKVLRYLINKGKPVIQSNIGKDLNIPKSTLFRIVRRLAELGLVNVEKRGKYNYVYVQSTKYVSDLLKRIEGHGG